MISRGDQVPEGEMFPEDKFPRRMFQNEKCVKRRNVSGEICQEEKCVRRRNVSGGEMCKEEKCVRKEMSQNCTRRSNVSGVDQVS